MFATIVTNSHLAGARVLAQSILDHHGPVPIYVLLADRKVQNTSAKPEPFTLITLPELGDADAINRMAFYYTPFEFCCALRPWLHNYLFNQTSLPDRWIFLDSDIRVQGSFTGIFAALGDASILLNPHACTHAGNKGITAGETASLWSGNFNAGFLGLRRCDETRRFISWFKDRLLRYCHADEPGQFVDQLWLNLAPVLFKQTRYVTDPGANLGHWNLFDRTLEIEPGGKVTVDGQPLLFAHFSGWDIDQPERVRKNKTEPRPAPQAWKQLGQSYRQALLDADYQSASKIPCAFGSFSDGTPITRQMRRIYYYETMAKKEKGDPFQRGAEFRWRRRLRFAAPAKRLFRGLTASRFFPFHPAKAT